MILHLYGQDNIIRSTNGDGPVPILKAKRLMQEIKAAGCSYASRSVSTHFIVYDPEGNPISSFAVMHPGNEVLSTYVSQVRKALARVKKK